jgi:hypothetical protein
MVCRRKEVKIFGFVGRMCVRKKNGGLGEKDLKWYNLSLLSGGGGRKVLCGKKCWKTSYGGVGGSPLPSARGTNNLFGGKIW